MMIRPPEEISRNLQECKERMEVYKDAIAHELQKENDLYEELAASMKAARKERINK
jgi:hypothetical protein